MHVTPDGEAIAGQTLRYRQRRFPRRFSGVFLFGGSPRIRKRIWQIDSSYLERDLEAVRDSPTHVSIMPSVTMLLAQYELAIANTQKYWQRVTI